jgi:hypothetical protein
MASWHQAIAKAALASPATAAIMQHQGLLNWHEDYGQYDAWA